MQARSVQFLNVEDIEIAVDTLNNGGIIAYPTETVYGLGCLPSHTDAVKRLLIIKQRSAEKGLILIGASREQIAPYVANLNDRLWQKLITQKNNIAIQRTTTWIVPAAKSVSWWLRGNRDTLAVRITQHTDARALCLACNSALVSTSANKSGSPPAQNHKDLSPALLGQLDYLLRGECGNDSVPSRIKDIITGEIIRS